MAGITTDVGEVWLLDEMLLDGDALKIGLFCNSSAPANYAALLLPDIDNGYAEQTLTSWNAATTNGTGEGQKEHAEITFQHDATGNFTYNTGATDPAQIYGVYVSDGTDIAYEIFSDAPINIGPSYKLGRKITIRFKAI